MKKESFSAWCGRKSIAIAIVAVLVIAFTASTGVAYPPPRTTKDLDVPYHEQKESTWCGAAVAQMWIDWNGYWASQSDLMNQYAGSDDLTNPYELRDMVEGETSKNCEVSISSSQSNVNYDVEYNIKYNDQPSGAMVWGGIHWMLVKGYSLNEYEDLTGFYVHDPSLNNDYPSGYQDYDTEDLGEDSYVTISTWNEDYFTWTNLESGESGYISVVDPSADGNSSDKSPGSRKKRPTDLEPAEPATGKNPKEP